MIEVDAVFNILALSFLHFGALVSALGSGPCRINIRERQARHGSAKNLNNGIRDGVTLALLETSQLLDGELDIKQDKSQVGMYSRFSRSFTASGVSSRDPTRV